MRFFNINEKRAALRAAIERPRPSRLERLRNAVVQIVYRIRKPNVRAGISVHSSMTDAVKARDLDAVELDWFGRERLSRGWMRDANAAGSVVPGSYDDEVRR